MAIRNPTTDALEIMRRIRVDGDRKLVRQIARLKACKRRLARRCPAAHPVRVRLAHLPKDLWGDCHLVTPRKGRPYFQVRLALHQDEASMRATLAHEWAHALAWWVDGKQDHGPGWGVALARCYRAAEQTT